MTEIVEKIAEVIYSTDPYYGTTFEKLNDSDRSAICRQAIAALSVLQPELREVRESIKYLADETMLVSFSGGKHDLSDFGGLAKAKQALAKLDLLMIDAAMTKSG